MINHNTAPYAALLLRTSLGVMFIAHALMKLLYSRLQERLVFFHRLVCRDGSPIQP